MNHIEIDANQSRYFADFGQEISVMTTDDADRLFTELADLRAFKHRYVGMRLFALLALIIFAAVMLSGSIYGLWTIGDVRFALTALLATMLLAVVIWKG